MKVLLYFTSILFVVYASPISEEVSDEILKLIARNVLDIVEGLKNDIDEVLGLVRKVEASIPKSHETIVSLRINNASIVMLLKNLKEATSNGKNNEYYQKLFDEKVNSLSTYVQQRLSDTVKGHIKDIESSLKLIQNELNKISDILKHNLDNELTNCRKDSFRRNVTGEFIVVMHKHFKFIDNLKPQINTLVENVLSRLEKEEVRVKSQNEIFKPVDDCLKK